MTKLPKGDRSFVPALGSHRLTPLYRPLSALTTPLIKRFLGLADVRPGMSVLDLGCGVGTLALLVARAQPTARVVGLEVDQTVLDIARRRIKTAGADIELRLSTIEDADFAPASFDRILTTFVLHHLSTEDKLSALREAGRILRPDGELHVADFGPPHNLRMRLASLPLARLGNDRTAANLSGRLPALMGEAGFMTVAEKGHYMTPLGTVIHWVGIP